MSIFAEMKKNFSDIVALIQAREHAKLESKLPSWAGTPGLEIPSSLALEQCSSESAALYKASLLECGSVADLDSGLGVDDWAFALKSREVHYNELNADLAAAAQRNFDLLGLENIICSNLDASQALRQLGQVDLIYMDPARRSADGRKVFLLEDCSPNVIALLPEIWEHCSTLMLKVSPMADITMLSSRLRGLCEIHVVALDGECKELLCIVRKDYEGPYLITAVELLNAETTSFDPAENTPAPLCGDIKKGNLLLEPKASILKTGQFGTICSRWSLSQLDTSTHLFLDKTGDSNAPDAFFKRFRVVEILPFGKAAFRTAGERYPNSDVTARNIPMSSEELKKRMGISGSGEYHIFGTCISGERRIVVTERIRP